MRIPVISWLLSIGVHMNRAVSGSFIQFLRLSLYLLRKLWVVPNNLLYAPEIIFKVMFVPKLKWKKFCATTDWAKKEAGGERLKMMHKVAGATKLLASKTRKKLYKAIMEASFSDLAHLTHNTNGKLKHIRRRHYGMTKLKNLNLSFAARHSKTLEMLVYGH